MTRFIPGQRWISDTESDLGLGIVQASDSNTVTVRFPACGEQRTYARGNAPLTRVTFARGATVEDRKGLAIQIVAVEDKTGLLVYNGKADDGREVTLSETDLSHHIQFNRPQDRLFAGRIDSSEWFELRLETWLQRRRLEQSPVLGLCGGRTSLLPHQVYIAHEVANRYAPRVLLADEVGLGKTIEAGLILHHQLLTGRAARVLIIVPEPLLHQWLVEMLRRFNLRFSLFDEERCIETHERNPFHAEQLILCSLDLFSRHPHRQQQALAGEWDLMVVDEAHHLQWSEQAASPEYVFIERLAAATRGVLLLTATPEQLGKSGHFARLRLLDRDRFFSYARFLEEQSHYRPVAEAAQRLLGDKPPDPETRTALFEMLALDQADELLGDLDNPAKEQNARQALVRLLLDRHGTGRILFRNTRAGVKGFPERRVHGYPLKAPAGYAPRPPDTSSPAESLYPERRHRADSQAGSEWWRHDPRVEWLIHTLSRLAGEKILLICGARRTALDLETALRVRAGVHAAVFHEGMSIVARDRAAAYFAAVADGTSLLICSEIGSEGRNFQFARHLVLFDLPFDPDILEQRIGRLDRIGQKHTIHIHVPYLEQTAHESLFRWYQDGLDAFRHPCPAAPSVFERMGRKLGSALQTMNHDVLDRLIALTHSLADSIGSELDRGREQLLEMNSCRADEAQRLIAAIRNSERRNDLWAYLERIFDHFGVDVEDHSPACYIITPGHHMPVSHFPGLPEDGATVTVDRETALAREDLFFLTWEHPLVTAAMDLIISGKHGNTALTVARHPALGSGQLLLEAVFILECPAPKALQIGRFLPPTPLRVLIDAALNDLSAKIPPESLKSCTESIDAIHAGELIRSQRDPLEKMLGSAEIHVKRRVPRIIADARRAMLDRQTGEIKRLTALKRVNPNVRGEEIDHLANATRTADEHLRAARVRLDALRVIVTA